jgi:hypothetical protein
MGVKSRWNERASVIFSTDSSGALLNIDAYDEYGQLR